MNKKSRKSLKAFALVLLVRIVKKYKAINQMKNCVKLYSKRMAKVNNMLNINETLKSVASYTAKNIKIKLDAIKFFKQDDVSHVEPGKKDCKSKTKCGKTKKNTNG